MKKMLMNYGGIMILYAIFILLMIFLCSDFLSQNIPESSSFVGTSITK